MVREAAGVGIEVAPTRQRRFIYSINIHLVPLSYLFVTDEQKQKNLPSWSLYSRRGRRK